MNIDADFPADPATRSEPRRRTLSISSITGPAELAAIELGDPARPLDVIFLHAQ